MTTSLLLIAHGSRQAGANDDLHWLAAELRAKGAYPVVEPAFLELVEPTIEQAARRCVEQGATRVVLVPYFLSAGVHVGRDLREARDGLAASHPAVSFRLAEPLGRHPLLIEVVTERAAEVSP